MFSPEEYIGYDSLRTHFEQWAGQVHLAYLLESVGADPSEAFRGDGRKKDVMHFRMEQLSLDRPMAELPRKSEMWRELSVIRMKDEFEQAIIFHCMFAKCIMQLDTLLSSSHGKVMRPDEYQFLHMDRLDWIYPNWPLNETSGLEFIFKLYEENKFSGLHLSERYCFLDTSLGVLKLKNNSISSFRTSSHFGSDEFSDSYIETHVRPFLGWAPIWDEKHLPQNMAQFLEDLGVLEQRWGVSSLFEDPESKPTPKKRRGPKPGPAKALFCKKYPDGLPEELSAEYVSADFKSEGVTISPRQIANYDREIRLRK
ncbi:hypothetical protein [Falsihalocynthiibacter arcticus]|uniref:Uncharacterized protein n=1 Tax=Falsihalocynthiibacter arcticus TaxID=1579316 RepID=A0A126V4G8_9RHOB|nr:hypothetical protein [Falsihalocynthiibacter arcticus]AML52589.1 hypothetical protein RC74_16105 [Falsihalocynthiibacter arcticus]